MIVPYLRGYGPTRFLSSDTFRNGQPSALAVDLIAFMDALEIPKAILAGFDWGARTANIVAALWPERCKAMVSVSGYLIGSQEAGKKPLPPEAELQWWYQFYFATERGRAGYDKYRHDFAKLIWQLASPKWKLRRRHVRSHRGVLRQPGSRRHRDSQLPLAAGPGRGRAEATPISRSGWRQFPVITVPTITMEGDANGAPHPEPASYARKFSGTYSHRTIDGGVGHNLPQEAPQAFAEAIMSVDGYAG